MGSVDWNQAGFPEKYPRPGRSPHGECGLKYYNILTWYNTLRRSPHGECGLKSGHQTKCQNQSASLPAWGVWIEIYRLPPYHHHPYCRSPHGECGLKYDYSSIVAKNSSRSPHGECGLKSALCLVLCGRLMSLPAWGVWIEISELKVIKKKP